MKSIWAVVPLLASLSAAAFIDHSALLELYSATNSDQWTRSDGWGTDDPPCSWFGVACAMDNHIM